MTNNVIPLRHKKKAHVASVPKQQPMSDEEIRERQRLRNRLAVLFETGDEAVLSMDQMVDAIFEIRGKTEEIVQSVHEVTNYDPRFGAAIAYSMFEVAMDEVTRLGLCGAIDLEDYSALLAYFQVKLDSTVYLDPPTEQLEGDN